MSKKERRKLQNKIEVTNKVTNHTCVPLKHSEWYTTNEEKWKSETSILEEDLTPDNYKDKFHHLLCWEEKEHSDLLSKYVEKRSNYTQQQQIIDIVLITFMAFSPY